MSTAQQHHLDLQELDLAIDRILPDAEADRVRAVYSRRSNERDRLLYSHFAPPFLFHAQERERKTLSLLSRNGLGDLRDKRILEVGWKRVGSCWTCFDGERIPKILRVLTFFPNTSQPREQSVRALSHYLLKTRLI